jgi:hypothetical protein
MATTATPADNSSWKNTTPQFSFTPDISSLASSDDALYMLSTSGDLYSSTDGTTWSSTGVAGWHSIIGGYTTSLLGVKKSGSQYSPAIYPSDSAVESQSLPDGFPVSGQSQLLIYTTEWSSSPQALFVGGRCADGSLSASSWGFDGTSWARFSYLPEKAALEGITLIPYTTFTVNTTNWTTTSYDTLFALGGRSASGEQSHTLYISRDWGLNWHLADDLMTLPDAMPSLAFAQGIVVNSVLGSSASTVAGWKSIATVKPNTLWWEIASPTSNSRATTPITSWDCPYIYLFGGESENGTLYNTVWRGVINRLTFKPLQ